MPGTGKKFTMRVQEFRELISDSMRLITDWSACVDQSERNLWITRAEVQQVTLRAAACTRASTRDIENHALAVEQLSKLLSPPTKPSGPLSSVVKATASSKTRAAKYNASASRAVRLSRAARSAKRRGYF